MYPTVSTALACHEMLMLIAFGVAAASEPTGLSPCPDAGTDPGNAAVIADEINSKTVGNKERGQRPDHDRFCDIAVLVF